MRNRWIRRIKRFIKIFTAGGVAYSSLGTEINISARGAVTIPTSEYEKIVSAISEEFERARANAQQRSLPKDSGESIRCDN